MTPPLLLLEYESDDLHDDNDRQHQDEEGQHQRQYERDDQDDLPVCDEK